MSRPSTALREIFSDPEVAAILTGADYRPEAVVNRIVQVFDQETQAPENETTADRERRLTRWFYDQCNREGLIEPFVTAASVLRQVVHEGPEAKARWFQQAPCAVCLSRSSRPSSRFTVRISPRSHQASDATLKRGFAKAVRSRLGRGTIHHYGGDALCVRIVLVLGPSRRRRLDADNLVKGFLDAMATVVYDDDSQIHHLDVVKMVGVEGEEYIAVRIEPTDINVHSHDLLRQRQVVHWAGSEMLDVADFLEELDGEPR